MVINAIYAHIFKLCWLEHQIYNLFNWKGITIFFTFLTLVQHSNFSTYNLFFTSILFQTWIGILPLNKRVEGKRGSDNHKITQLLTFWSYYTDFEKGGRGRTENVLHLHIFELLVLFLHLLWYIWIFLSEFLSVLQDPLLFLLFIHHTLLQIMTNGIEIAKTSEIKLDNSHIYGSCCASEGLIIILLFSFLC